MFPTSQGSRVFETHMLVDYVKASDRIELPTYVQFWERSNKQLFHVHFKVGSNFTQYRQVTAVSLCTPLAPHGIHQKSPSS